MGEINIRQVIRIREVIGTVQARPASPVIQVRYLDVGKGFENLWGHREGLKP